MSSPQSMEQLANRLVRACETSNREELEKVYAPEALIWHNFDRKEQSRADNIELLTNLAGLFNSFTVTQIRRNFFPGGYVQQHVVKGEKKDGRPFELPACIIVTVRDGMISRIDEYYDSAHDARPADQR